MNNDDARGQCQSLTITNLNAGKALQPHLLKGRFQTKLASL